MLSVLQKIRIIPISLHESILEHMLLHKSYMNVIIANILSSIGVSTTILSRDTKMETCTRP